VLTKMSCCIQIKTCNSCSGSWVVLMEIALKWEWLLCFGTGLSSSFTVDLWMALRIL